MRKQVTVLSIFLFVFLCLNFALWASVRDVQARWLNVPPPPLQNDVGGFGLGDKSFAYRNIAMMLQNLGDTGGRSTPLHEYNYERLSKWFFLADRLDQRSSFIPFIAANYFGAVQKADRLPPLIEYLSHIGQRGVNEHWRWLAQAIHLTRYRLNDLPLALDLSKKLAALDDVVSDLPVWAKTMDVLIMNVQGEKEAAYQILMQTLQSDAENLHPSETLFMVDLICSELLDEEEAKAHPLCQQLPF